MFFFFTCGTHVFQSALSGYERIQAQCQNCGNFSARVTKRWEWFTFCFVPIIPFSLKPWKEVSCTVCHFHQDLKQRPDVEQQMNGGGNNMPMQPGPGGPHGGPPPGQYGPKPGYGNPGHPAYG